MTNRNLTLDLTKIVLALSVVGIHAGFLLDTNPDLGYLLVNGAFRIAVPVFLTINGYYLYGVIEKDHLIPWMKRIMALYAFWMAVYLPFWAFGDHPSVAKLIHHTVFGYHHLWYVAGIIGGATIIYFVRHVSVRIGMPGSLAAFVTGVVIQYFGVYHIFPQPIDILANYNWSHRNFLLLAFPFMYAGYLIRRFRLGDKIPDRFLVIWTVSGLLLLFLEAGLNLNHATGVDGFDNLGSLMLLCPAILLLALRSPRVYEGKVLSSISSGIYFIHPIFIFLLLPYVTSSIVLFVLTSGLSFVASFLLIKINDRVRFIL